MNKKYNTALILIKNFCISHFKERNVQKSISYLSKDIHWFGTANNEDVINIKEAYDYLHSDILAHKEPYFIDFIQENEQIISTDVSLANLKIKLTGGGISVLVRISVTACIENETMKICNIHMSIPDSNQKDEEYFPFTLAKEMKLEIEQSKKQMENIVNSIPGGIATYKVFKDRFELIYCSEGVAELYGRTFNEYSYIINSNIIESAIYYLDKERVITSIQKGLKNNIPIDITYRIPHKNGNPIWIHLQGIKAGEQDGYPILHCVFHNISKDSALYLDILNEIPLIIIVNDINTKELFFANKTAIEFSGGNPNYYVKKCYQYMMHCNSPCSFCHIPILTKEMMYEGVEYVPKLQKYYNVKSKLINWNGRDASLELVDDITEQKLSNTSLWKRAEKAELLDMLFNNATGGIFRSNINNIFKIEYANDTYYAIHGYTREEYNKNIANDVRNIIFPEDFDYISNSVNEYLQGKTSELSFEYRIIKNDGAFAYLRTSAVIKNDSVGNLIMVGLVIDITKSKLSELKFIEQSKEISQIYNSIPGGAFRCKYNEDFDIIFANDGLFRFLGYTREEFKELFQDKMAGVIYEEDKPQVNSAIKSQIGNGTTVENVNRLVCKDGSIKWISIHAELTIAENGEQHFYCLFVDITTQKQVEEELAISKMKTESIINAIPGGVAIYKVSDIFETLYFSDGVPELTGYTIEEYSDLIKRDAIEMTYHEDTEMVAKNIRDAIYSHEIADFCFRKIHKNGSIVWVHLQGKKITDDNGYPIIQCVFHNITDQKNAENELKKASDQTKALVSNTPGGIIKIVIKDKEPVMTYASNGIANLLGYSVEELMKINCQNIYLLVHPEDLERVTSELSYSINKRCKFESQYRLHHKDGHYIWVSMIANILKDTSEGDVFYGSYTDISTSKELEYKLKESEKRYALATHGAGLCVWEYNIKDDSITLSEKSSENYGYKRIIENLTEFVQKNDFIRKDSMKEFINMHKQMKKNSELLSGDFWVKGKSDTEYSCRRITYSIIRDKKGDPIKAFGASRDITEFKIMEKRFNNEIIYRAEMEKSVISTCRVNLTQKIVEDKSYLGIIKEDKIPYDEFRLEANKFIADSKEAKRIYDLFSSESLISNYHNGNRQIKGSYRICKEKDTFMWLQTTVNLLLRPETSDIIAFFYTKDISHEKMLQSIIDSIIRVDYDFLVTINAVSGTATLYSSITDCAFDDFTDNFDEAISHFFHTYCEEKDVQYYIRQCQLSNVIKELEKSDTFSVNYSRRISNGTKRQKQLHFSYVSRNENIILLTRTDITSLIEEQKLKQNALEKALKIAEDASTSKSEFLARMSHEIRTPMNAIMGMAEIASTNLSNKEFVLDCINKSQSASRYLLSLINDILDMSRIESGKIALVNNLFSSNQFILNINTLIESQAKNAGIIYNFDCHNGLADYYRGDITRLQQILVNLLNNAVKFTKPGGKVVLLARQISKTETKALVEFVISDTGVGISPNFIPKLFEPFSQEYDGITTKYGGSGLGLAIAKNLARLMDGDITVESTVGIGTTFTVVVSLGVAKNKEGYIHLSHHHFSHNYDFKGKHILLVEDHPLNTMVASRLLANKGFLVIHAENGETAIQKFSETPIGFFNAILMDIRMPVMDGLTSTKLIRNLQRDDAKTIPIIAMTANAFDEDMEKSKMAGMNGHLSKPIEPEKLYSTLNYYIFKNSHQR